MSFEPPAPGRMPPFTPSSQPPGPVASRPLPAAPGKRRVALLALGLVLAAGGVLAGLLIFLSADQDAAVKNFARAPIGCSTTLNVEKTATFNIYLEHAGRLPEYSGDCAAAGTYATEGEIETPVVAITQDEADVELREAGGERYDAAGFKGQRIFTAKLEEGKSYRITVTSSAPEAAEQAAVAVGVDSSSPSKLSATRSLGIGALVAGLVLGIPLILLGLRRRPGQPAVPPGGPPAVYAPMGYPPATEHPTPPPASWGQPPPNRWGQPPPPPNG